MMLKRNLTVSKSVQEACQEPFGFLADELGVVVGGALTSTSLDFRFI